MGKVICIGLGPGDPELMSVKAHRLLTGAQHVAFFRKPGRRGQARTIVDGIMAETAVEHAMEYPVTTEIHFSDPEYNRLLSAFYDDWADRLTDLAQTEDVIVLCEGDPFFYGSFMHLHSRLQGRAEVEPPIIQRAPGDDPLDPLVSVQRQDVDIVQPLHPAAGDHRKTGPAR